jgi:putative Ca2+/H+ antiporter (TMEM165/GDT1 family)
MSVGSPAILRWVVGVSFLAMGAWALVPDTLDQAGTATAKRRSVFATTLIAFFLAEMGDKTQLATVAMAAKYAAPITVVAGTTLGMMIANIPAVLLGEGLLKRVSLRVIHAAAALVFAALGLATLLGAGSAFGI